MFGNARDKSGRVVNAVTFQQKGELYKKTPDCSKGGGSAYMDVFRFSNVGMYDHIDNAGIRVFGGMRPSCRDSAVVAALGMLGINGNTAPCTCNYSFQTFVGLAPVERPRNEDWTIYYDAFPKGAVRRMAINLAAPGDHLGGAGEMWLGFPRPMFQYAMRLPIWVERMGQFGTYVFNSDRTPIEGTDRPWVYTSGVRGFQKATVLLELPGGFTSVKCSTPPTIDGVIDEDCWRPVSGTGVEGRNSLFVCHDDKNFYIAIRRHSEVGPRGLKPWNKGAAGRDAPVWENGTYSSFEFYMGRFALKFKNTAWRNVGIHLGLSASGALYDASWECNSERRGVTEDPNWDGEWTYKVRTDKDAFVAELSVPWDSLTTAGISRDAPLQILADSLKRRGPLRGKRPILGSWGHPADRKTFVLAFAEPELPRPARKYTVRLHFAEVDEVEPGRRVFDIKLQGKIVRRGFDIIGETGARHKALVKQFEDIEASDRVTVEFVPRVEALSKETVPLLSGLEVIEQR